MPSYKCLQTLFNLSRDSTAHASIISRSLLAPSQTACFSTSATRFANPSPKKKGMAAPPKRGTRTLNVKKGRKTPGGDTGKRPAPGERKAIRKRIVLSNNNALEVSSLKDLDKRSVLSDAKEGQMRGLPDHIVDALRAVDAFKTSQGWSMFRRPAVLMRKETNELANLMKEVEGSADGQQKKTIRRVLAGDRMSGKSTLLLQGLAMAFLRDWVVINLPEAQDIVNAHTDYAPLPQSQPTQYTQDTYTANLLSQMIKSNGAVFETPVTTKPTLPVPLPAKSNLKQLAQLGVATPEVSWPIFMALWKELTQPGRPPIMLSIDGLSHIMKESEYLSADMKLIHAHDLTLIRHFVDHFSGKSPLPNGGIVLGATSGSNSPTSPTLNHSIEAALARQSQPGSVPQWNLYKKLDERSMDALKDIHVLMVGGISKEEARAVMEYYAESGMLRHQVNDGFVSEKWSLAGMGNIGELERASVRLRI